MYKKILFSNSNNNNNCIVLFEKYVKSYHPNSSLKTKIKIKISWERAQANSCY